MNSKTLNYNSPAIDAPTLPQKGIFTAIAGKITSLFARDGVAQAQKHYRHRPAQFGTHRNIVDSLPIEEKLRLGMYRFMD